jgi:hypothetical protein
MEPERLEGGNDAGAIRVGTTVRRPTRVWTPAVHDLLRHLDGKCFAGAPRVLGFDTEGREILTYIEGDAVGNRTVWPAWARSEDALVQAGHWLRAYHAAVADFVPRPGALWRTGETWSPGLIIAHNDASPFNAAWSDGHLAGFFDWDFAGPASVESDVGWTAVGWVPLSAWRVAAAEGFPEPADRPRRLRMFLEAYGWRGDPRVLVAVVQERMRVRAEEIRRRGALDEALYGRLLRGGVADDMELAVRELDELVF